MSKVSHKYLTKFKKLEAKLQILSGSRGGYFNAMLDRASERNELVRVKKPLIQDLYALRNVFAHADTDKYIANVLSSTYLEIDKIVDNLENPPSIGEFFKAKVFTVVPNDIVETVVKKMADNLYTHVPVYDHDKFLGVFSESTLLEWLVENISEGRAQFYKRQIKDVNPKYLNLKTNIVKFSSKNEGIFSIPTQFEKAIDNNSRLGAILITNSGKKNEKPIGIITAWDLPRIRSYIA